MKLSLLFEMDDQSSQGGVVVTSLPLQLFVGSEAPVRSKIIPVTNDVGYSKPSGGLWTSTWREESRDSDWVEWCHRERRGALDGAGWWLLRVAAPVRLVRIDSDSDLEVLASRYGHSVPSISLFGGVSLDFERLAEDFDGVHMSSPVIDGWDVESTLWFRWCFSGVEAIDPCGRVS